MSQDQPNILASPQRRYYLWGGGAVVLVAVLMLWVFYRPRAKTTVARANTAEDSLAVARQTLNRGTDLVSCRNAIQEINRFVEQHPGSVTPLSSQEGAALAQRFGLDDSAVAEMSSPSFTLLDGWHLHQCLQFRDAAKALLITNLPAGPDGKVIRQTGLDRAVAGFDWVMRQMRLQEHNGPLIPPLYALRRGWGTGLERGLVFLELLRQLGPADELQGCLVYCPDKQGGPLRFWACGVIVDNGKAVYLFDPRLGLALPGPEGKGIATLTQVSKDPTVLAQLNRAASKSEVYDVEPDQAAHAEIQQVCNLSALAPRVRFVEETLQASAGRVRLAVQAEEEAKRLTQASGTNSCRAWRAPGPDGQGEDGPGLVRRFLPTLEGGIDTAEPGGRLWLFRRSLVPLQLLPGRINRIPLDSNLGNGIGWYFTRPFTEAVMTPGKPRDLMLRGQLTTAVRELVNQDEEIRRRQALRQSAGNLDKGIDDFLKEIVPLYADQVRNRTNPAALAQTNREIDEAWQHGEPLLLLLEGATSQVRLAETAYLLALCKQEEAERIQSRLDLLSGARVKISPDEAKQAASAWSAAKDNWEAALRSNPTDAMIPFVRLHSARCLFHLGRKTEAAEEWVKASHELPGLQRVAASYLAARK